MSGGAWEYMMSGMLDSTNNALLSGKNSTYHSNFNGAYGLGESCMGGINLPIPKYFDAYIYSVYYTMFNRRILGDGTSEFGPFRNITYKSQISQIDSWYDDEFWFVNTYGPWFLRGGSYDYGLGAGVFALHHDGGHAHVNSSFRIVLAI